jgi:hypothetical protein
LIGKKRIECNTSLVAAPNLELNKMTDEQYNAKVALSSLRALGEIILDDDIDDVALRPKAVPRDKLQEQVAGLHDWVSGKGSDAFHGIVVSNDRNAVMNVQIVQDANWLLDPDLADPALADG